MKRRNFFKNSTAALATGLLTSSMDSYAAVQGRAFAGTGRVAKNIIFLVSDGMSNGTLTMADLLL